VNRPDRVSVVCTAPGCEHIGWRGSAGEGAYVAQVHDEDHAAEARPEGTDPPRASVIPDIPGESDRERAGRIVRTVWVQLARERSDTNPAHLTPWPELNAQDRDIDERIGVALAADFRLSETERRAGLPGMPDLEAGA
jgi:hypothetical protein